MNGNRQRYEPVRHWSHGLLAFALVVTSAGCLILPTPEFDSGEARANIKKMTPAQFEPGMTTRAEVILALGEPDAVSPDECSLIYRSEKVCGLWFVGGYYSGAGGTIERDRYLVADFDGRGVLAKFERSASWVGSKTPGALLRNPNPTTGWTRQPETVVRQSCRGHWYPNVDGYQSAHANAFIGHPGQLILTDTRLCFVTDSQWANAEPALSLAYETLGQVRLAKLGFGRRVVVRTQSGEVHAFTLYGNNGVFENRPVMEAVREFLESATTVQKHQ